MSTNFEGGIQELHLKIKEILLKSWDPIGIGKIPEGNNEYDTYIPHLSRMIISGESVSAIYDYLIWLEGEHMGLPVNHKLTMNISKMLFMLCIQESGAGIR